MSDDLSVALYFAAYLLVGFVCAVVFRRRHPTEPSLPVLLFWPVEAFLFLQKAIDEFGDWTKERWP